MEIKRAFDTEKLKNVLKKILENGYQNTQDSNPQECNEENFPETWKICLKRYEMNENKNIIENQYQQDVDNCIDLEEICSKIVDEIYENEIFYQAYIFMKDGESRIKINLFENEKNIKIESDLISKYKKYIDIDYFSIETIKKTLEINEKAKSDSEESNYDDWVGVNNLKENFNKE